MSNKTSKADLQKLITATAMDAQQWEQKATAMEVEAQQWEKKVIEADRLNTHLIKLLDITGRYFATIENLAHCLRGQEDSVKK